jgi:hypothetical protein
MPDGRFLSKRIALSAQLAAVPLESAFLFTWMIPHLDVEGRMLGDEVAVKASVVPLRTEFTLESIRDHLLALARAPRDYRRRPLLYWYEVQGRRYVEFPGFRDHQKGMRVQREAKSQLPGHAHGGAIDLTTTYDDHSGAAPVVAPELLPDLVQEPVPELLRLSEVKNFTTEAEPQASERGDAPVGALPLDPEISDAGSLSGQELLDRKAAVKAQLAAMGGAQ